MDQYKGVANMWQMALSSLYHLSSLAQEKLPSFNASEWALIYIYAKRNGLQWIVLSIYIFFSSSNNRMKNFRVSFIWKIWEQKLVLL